MLQRATDAVVLRSFSAAYHLAVMVSRHLRRCQPHILNALTVDVEEGFDASEVQRTIRPGGGILTSRVHAQTQVVLDLLSRHDTRATFFILGSVAERCPALVRSIADAGHEIGCHSYSHRLVYDLTPEEFRADTRRAVNAIAAACGIIPRIYRAPSYSITARSLWALEILVECGFTHDSSIYPIQHDRYGVPGFERQAHTLLTSSGEIYEIPVATVNLSTRVAPIGGGAYLRLLPYRYVAAGIRRLNLVESQPACIYFHPWELDPDQPRIAHGLAARLRTYAGLKRTHGKIVRLLKDFRFSTIGEVYACSNAQASVPASRMSVRVVQSGK